MNEVRVGEEIQIAYENLETDDFVVRLLDGDQEDTGTELTVDNPTQETHVIKWTPAETGVFYIEVTIDGVVEPLYGFFAYQGNGQILLEDQEIVFATTASPLYVDPEEFLPFYSEANNVEILELIHRYSRDIEKLMGHMEDPPLIVLEYIRAAVLCALARTYDYTFGGDATSLSLGDLKISRQSYPREKITRANAANWCELAAVLYEELRRGEAGIKAVVKGTKYRNPMPHRKLKSPYGKSGGRSRF